MSKTQLTELWSHSTHVAAVSHVVARRFTQINPDTALLAGLLGGVGKLYLLTRAARFPGMLADPGTYQRVVAEWHGRIAQAILRNWEVAEEIITAVGASEIAIANTMAPPISPTCSRWAARWPRSAAIRSPKRCCSSAFPPRAA